MPIARALVRMAVSEAVRGVRSPAPGAELDAELAGDVDRQDDGQERGQEQHVSAGTGMAEAARWEYCELVLEFVTEKDGRWWCDLNVYYIGDPIQSVQISSREESSGRSWATPTGAWRLALSKLGAAGWELVNVQHGGSAPLLTTEAIAYFKRPIQVGRATNQPEISF